MDYGRNRLQRLNISYLKRKNMKTLSMLFVSLMSFSVFATTAPATDVIKVAEVKNKTVVAPKVTVTHKKQTATPAKEPVKAVSTAPAVVEPAKK